MTFDADSISANIAEIFANCARKGYDGAWSYDGTHYMYKWWEKFTDHLENETGVLPPGKFSMLTLSRQTGHLRTYGKWHFLNEFETNPEFKRAVLWLFTVDRSKVETPYEDCFCLHEHCNVGEHRPLPKKAMSRKKAKQAAIDNERKQQGLPPMKQAKNEASRLFLQGAVDKLRGFIESGRNHNDDEEYVDFINSINNSRYVPDNGEVKAELVLRESERVAWLKERAELEKKERAEREEFASKPSRERAWYAKEQQRLLEEGHRQCALYEEHKCVFFVGDDNLFGDKCYFHTGREFFQKNMELLKSLGKYDRQKHGSLQMACAMIEAVSTQAWHEGEPLCGVSTLKDMVLKYDHESGFKA
jgi:hypothetical protein